MCTVFRGLFFTLLFIFLQPGLAQDLEKINRLIKENEFDQALKLLSVEKASSTPLLRERLAYIYLQKGRSDLALDYIRISLESIGDEMADSLKVRIYNTYGLISWNTGNIQEAETYMQQALNITTRSFGSGSEKTAAAYNNLGLVLSTENRDRSLENYEKALSIYRKTFPDGHPKLARAYINVAINYENQGFIALARDLMQDAFAVWKKLGAENSTDMAFVLANLARNYKLENRTDSSQSYAQQALRIYLEKRGDVHPEVASMYQIMAGNYIHQQKWDSAMLFYQKALMANSLEFKDGRIEQFPAAGDYLNADLLLQLLLGKAQTLEQKYSLQSLKFSELQLALRSLQKADTVIDIIREIRRSEADKVRLGEISSRVYEDAINLCLLMSKVSLRKSDYLELAFYFTEKSKGAALEAAISETRAKEFAGVSADLLEKEKQLKSELAFYAQRLASGEADQNDRESYFELNRQFADFVQDLEQNFPQYHKLKYDVSTVTASELKQKLPENTALLSYFISNTTSEMHCFVVDSRGLRVYSGPLVMPIDRQVKALRNTIEFRAKQSFTRANAVLSGQLFMDKLKNRWERLVIIPQGRVTTIPFEVLFRKKVKEQIYRYDDLPYLINDFEVSYDFSATLFARKLEARSHQQKPAVLFYAPIEFGDFDLPSLPGSSEEVSRISSLMSRRGGVCRVEMLDQAKESMLKNTRLLDYSLIHFATHGVVNEEEPDLSRIYLGSDENDDGQLFNGEIYNLKLNADLVTLSACQTGLGKVAEGEGMMGLSRAFIYAGARNLLVSLWQVSDQSTSDLMIDFYDRDITNPAFAGSLREAKLTMIEDKVYANPYYWAPFILIGR